MADSEARKRTVLELVRSLSTMTLSTVDDTGWPQATPLFYLCGDDLGLYWFSSAGSAHSRMLAREPRAAVAISRETDRWQQICGVQMRGVAGMVGDPAIRKDLTEAYCRRFGLGELFKPLMAQKEMFRFAPHWIRYIDNRERFGFKFEIVLPEEPG